MARRAGREHPGCVAWRGDAAVIRSATTDAVVARCRDNHDSGIDDAFCREREKVEIVRFVDSRAEGNVDHADVLHILVGEDVPECGDDIADPPAAGPVEHFQFDNVSCRRNARESAA